MILQYPQATDAPAAESEPSETSRWATDSGMRPSARLERLVREHCKLLWRIAQRLGVDAAEAEDITQSVFLVAAKRLDDLLAGRERAFLVQTTVFITRRALRKSRHQHTELPEDLVTVNTEAVNLDEQIDQRRSVLLLDSMLKLLPMKLREVLVLFELEGYSQSEIAEQLGLPVGTVASRLNRGRERFMRIAAKHKAILGADR